MKQMKYNIIFILISLILTSCNDFLEEKSNDKIIPKTVDNYEELLYGEAYFKGNETFGNYLDIMTDDVKCYTKGHGSSILSSDAREVAYGYYAWQQEPEIATSGSRNNDISWKKLYHSILMCNIVINDLPDMEGTDDEKYFLNAEALFIRAFDYFYLVNLYGEPYNKSSASMALGVPINNLTGMEDVSLSRVSVEENYNKIMYDLKNSIELFKKTTIVLNHFKANIESAYLLASRVSLYMKNYKDVVKYADLVIAKKPSLYDLKTKDPKVKFINNFNPEILFAFGYYRLSYFDKGFFTVSNFPISDNLKALYFSNDLRKNVFFSSDMPNKNGTENDTKTYGYAMRTSEAYLNRAEAYTELDNMDKALVDINKLRSYRFSDDNYNVSASLKEDVLTIVKDERRRELCFEKQRWFDLRRWGMPRIEHVYKAGTSNVIDEVYVLNEGDVAYTLPIPYSEMERNTKIVNIKRPERSAQ